MATQRTHSARSDTSSTLLQDQDDDYDVYLFWPSLNTGTNRHFNFSVSAANHTPPLALAKPFHRHSDLDSGPSIRYGLQPRSSCASIFGFPYPSVNATHEVVPKSWESPIQNEHTLHKYSAIFRMGLFFTRATHHVDRAVRTVKLKLRKTKAARARTKARTLHHH
ncbi:hypothetical protein BC834DRAFT_513 [Gloeopeniophorella convolvens]|nr:hypothetical protein BC834DRAFT_513 [Gloeopeniophorella convolvens]